jgi:hypothetical protein
MQTQLRRARSKRCDWYEPSPGLGGWPLSRCSCVRGGPSPSADVGGVGRVPVQMWEGESSPGSDAGRGLTFVGSCSLSRRYASAFEKRRAARVATYTWRSVDCESHVAKSRSKQHGCFASHEVSSRRVGGMYKRDRGTRMRPTTASRQPRDQGVKSPRKQQAARWRRASAAAGVHTWLGGTVRVAWRGGA